MAVQRKSTMAYVRHGEPVSNRPIQRIQPITADPSVVYEPNLDDDVSFFSDTN